MAINTRSRRASVVGLAAAAMLTLPLADSAVGDEDRQHVAFCYAGIAVVSIGYMTATFTAAAPSATFAAKAASAAFSAASSDATFVPIA